VLATPCLPRFPDLVYSASRNLVVRKHIALTIIVGAALMGTVWKHAPLPWTVTQSVGLCLMVLGFVMWTVARFQLGASFAVTARAKQLVTHGLYSKIRNPIYVFGSCVMAGAILLFLRPIWLLVFLAVIPLQIWRAGKEAHVLEEKFGEEYRVYRGRTRF
jgi:protein-S-isoprenylcysteine O-methyltransferase Ste14